MVQFGIKFIHTCNMATKKRPSALSWIIKEAKVLRKKDRNRKEWKDYVAQSSAIYASKHKGKSPIGKPKKKVGKTILLEKNETAKSRTKKVVRIHRNKNGTFDKITSKSVGNITDMYRYLQNSHYLKQLEQLNKDLARHTGQLNQAKIDKRNAPTSKEKSHLDKYIAEINRHIDSTKKRITQIKSLIK